MTALEVLRQAMLELERPDYGQYKDRALGMLDEACRSLLPVVGRTPEQHTALVRVRKEAQRAIGCTVVGRELSEEESYFVLYEMGGISQADLWVLINRTITRVEQQTIPIAVAAE